MHLSSPRVWIPVGALVVGVVALAASSGGTSRGAVLSALERPAASARATVGPGPARALLSSGPYRLSLGLAPNRGSVADRLSVNLTDNGRQVDGARVAVSFSMPSMNMWTGYVSSLPPTIAGSSSTSEPVLGMPGMWQLNVRVTLRNGTTFKVVVDDLMQA